MPAPRRPKPWRGFPSVNAAHGLRMRINQATPDPGRGEVKFSALAAAGAKSMGTIPAGAYILGVSRAIETAFTATTTLDMGVAAGGTTVATNTVLIPGTATAAGPTARYISTLGAGAAMPTVDTEIWMTMGTLLATAGLGDFLLEFYVNKD